MLEEVAIPPLWIATAAVAVLLSIVHYVMKNRDIPPGPTGLPYLGLWAFLKDDKCHLQLQDLGKKYGDIFSFTSTGKLIINLGSVKTVREALVTKSDCFAGRPTDFSILTVVMKDGVTMLNGEAWKTLRKFFNQSFREYGFTFIKESTSGSIQDSISQTIDDFRERAGQPFNPVEVLSERCLGTIRKIMLGDENISFETMRKMIHSYMVSLECLTGSKLLPFGFIAKILFKIRHDVRNSVRHHKILCAYLLEAVKKIEASMDENHATCVVEEYFKERNLRKKKNDPTWKYFTDKALVISLTQLVGDGVFGVATFISSFLDALVRHPEEQEKIYKELMDVVGPSRLPTIEDKNKLPYTNAFINEVIRHSNFFPMIPTLECSRETTIKGYRIPKGSIILENFWQANHDPGTYENPEKFDPTRFISTPEKPREELPIQFGMGKRSCSGEAYVMTQSFLFLTSIVKNFTISKSKISKGTPMVGDMEISVIPRTEK